MFLGVFSVRVKVSLGNGLDPEPFGWLGEPLAAGRRHELKLASGYLLPAAVAAVLGARWREAAARAALVEVGGPLLAALVGIGALELTIRRSIHPVSNARVVPSLAPIDEGFSSLEGCTDLPLGAIARAGGGRLTLPDGPAGGDFDDAFKRLERLAPDDDLWLSIDADGTPFGETGALLAAAGRSRGPRGLAVGATEPLRGCAFGVVGRAPSGFVSCAEPIALGVEGCKTKNTDYSERVLRARLRADRTVFFSVHISPKHVITEAKTGPLDELTQLAGDMWRVHGEHRDPYDRESDPLELEIAPTVPLRDVLAALRALRAVVREVHVGGKSATRPAFSLSVALVADDAR
jgi:hypothetical protein